jgi:phosphoglycerol transferase MdoB-like AlkP superfamily enzyme
VPLLTKELRFFLRAFFASMAMFSLFRLAFYMLYRDEFAGVPFLELGKAFLFGLRFDAALSAVGFTGILILAHVPLIGRIRPYRALWILAAHLIFLVYFLLAFADLLYFPFSHKRLGYEAFVYLNASMLPIIKTAFLSHPMLFLLGLAVLVWYVRLAVRSARTQRLLDFAPLSARRLTLTYLVLVPLLIVVARGGIQRVPLREADAFISHYNSVNVLTINGPYTALRSVYRSKPVRLIDSDSARREALAMLGLDKSPPADSQYPLYRITDSRPVRKLNVVIILMESWTGKFVGPLGDTLGITPEFDRLARSGNVFNRFFANGYRTTSGTFCSLTGFPDQVGLPILRRQELQDNFASLSVRLKQQGYTNIFVHGGILDFENLGNMLEHEKFDVIIGNRQMRGCGGEEKAWGYDDQYIFDRALREFRSASQRPFFGYVLSVSTHPPGEMGSDSFAVIAANQHPEARYLNAYHYSDWALGRFIEQARQEPWFDSTIFVITGDHTHHTDLNMYENQQIPMLIYAPAILPPAVRTVIGSQVDIPVTLASILHLPYRADMGRDLFSLPDSAGFALWISGENLGWIEGDHIAIMGLDGRTPLVYNYRASDFHTDRARLNSALGDSIRVRAQSYYQLATDLLYSNRIVPAPVTNR